MKLIRMKVALWEIDMSQLSFPQICDFSEKS